MFNQTHYGTGDNVAGNKFVINNKQPDRSISSFKDDLIEKIKRSPRNYKIFLSSGDHEMESFAKEIDDVFKMVGWVSDGFIYNLAGFYPAGVTFQVKNIDETAKDIVNLFHSNGLKVSGNKTEEANQFGIFIGPNK